MITFLRHYALEYPYDSWKNLSLAQYQALTEGNANPHISKGLDNYLEENFQREDFLVYDVILTSKLLRTKETAKTIKEKYHLEIEIVSSDLLNEIPSKIIELPREKEFQSMKDNNQNKIQKKRILNKSEKIKKILEIHNLLNNYSTKNVLVITHSYLIGQLNYYLNIIKQDVPLFNEIQADTYEIGGYLNGFSVDN